jgi:hypothetical protein
MPVALSSAVEVIALSEEVEAVPAVLADTARVPIMAGKAVNIIRVKAVIFLLIFVHLHFFCLIQDLQNRLLAIFQD